MALSDRVLYKGPDELRKEAKEEWYAHNASYEELEERFLNVANTPQVAKELEQVKEYLAANGNVAEFWGLYTMDGKRVCAKLINTRYGECWAVCNRRLPVKPLLTLGGACILAGVPEETKEEFMYFVPFCKAAAELHNSEENLARLPKRQARQIRKDFEARIAEWQIRHGFMQQREQAPAKAVIAAHSLAEHGSAWVKIVRADRGYPDGALIVKDKPNADRKGNAYRV